MKKFTLLAIMLAAVLIVAAGCGGGSTDASQAIDQAFQNSMDYETLHTDFTVELGVDGDLSSVSPGLEGLTPFTLSLNGNADMDFSDSSNPAAKGSISLEGLDEIIQAAIASSGGDDASGALGAGMFGSLLSNIDFVLLDKVAYVNIMGSWYQTDTGSVMSGTVGGSEDIDTSCFKDAAKNISPSQMLTGIEEIGSEDVDGEKTTHYKAAIDTNGLIDIAVQMSEDCGQAEAAAGAESAKSSMSQAFKKLDTELWIDGDNNLRKVVLDAELDGSALGALGTSTSISSDETQAMESLSVTLVVTTTQSRFNEDVDITAPEGAMPLEDLMGLGDSLGGLGGLGDMGDLGMGDSGGTGTTTGTSTTDSGTGTSTSPYSMDE